MRRFARIVCFASGAVCGLALAGCTPTGNYQVSWNFFARADGTGDVQAATVACGMHGVDAILIQGTSGGNGTTAIRLCTPGTFTGTVDTGDWTFQLLGWDVRGRPIGDMSDVLTTTTMTVSQGGTAVFPTVTLRPRPECADGIDNDGDGLVDKDDPGCANFDPNGPNAKTDTTLESSAGPGTPVDGGGTSDGGGADGGATDGVAMDGVAMDGGATDGMTVDAPAADGPELDGGVPDAAPVDAGLPDDAAAGG